MPNDPPHDRRSKEEKFRNVSFFFSFDFSIVKWFGQEDFSSEFSGTISSDGSIFVEFEFDPDRFFSTSQFDKLGRAAPFSFDVSSRKSQKRVFFFF